MTPNIGYQLFTFKLIRLHFSYLPAIADQKHGKKVAIPGFLIHPCQAIQCTQIATRCGPHSLISRRYPVYVPMISRRCPVFIKRRDIYGSLFCQVGNM